MAIEHAGRLGSNAILAGATTIVVTLSTGLAVGAIATLYAGTNSTVAVTGVTDSRGNTWTIHAGGGADVPALASTKIITALQIGDTVTVTFAVSANRRAAAVDGWTGLDPTTWFETTAADASSDNDATVDTPTVSPSGSALLLAASYASGSLAGRSFTAGADYTALTQVAVDNGVTYVYLWSEWRAVATGGSYDATGTINGGAAVHAERVAAFKGIDGGGSNISPAPGGRPGPGKGGGNKPSNRPILGGHIIPRKLRLGAG